LRKKIFIGRNDKVSFDGLGLKHIDAKIDTGAYTSSLHCSNIHIEIIKEQKTLCFQVLDIRHKAFTGEEIRLSNYSQKWVKSSSGHSELRFFITAEIQLFNQTFPIELSLTDRGDMKKPVLIGRRFLAGKFVINPSKTNLSFKNKTKYI